MRREGRVAQAVLGLPAAALRCGVSRHEMRGKVGGVECGLRELGFGPKASMRFLSIPVLEMWRSDEGWIFLPGTPIKPLNFRVTHK